MDAREWGSQLAGVLGILVDKNKALYWSVVLGAVIINFIELGNPPEILVVEDRPSDVELMREALDEYHKPLHLHVVRDGEEALEFLRQQGKYENAPRPDLILLDLNLPKLNGREVLAAIKADPKLKLLPVVVLTTSTTAQDILLSYELHANCCITKPADLDQFIEVIQVTLKFWLTFVALPLATEKY